MRKRVDWALEVVEMEEYKKSEPHLLSGGQGSYNLDQSALQPGYENFQSLL